MTYFGRRKTLTQTNGTVIKYWQISCVLIYFSPYLNVSSKLRPVKSSQMHLTMKHAQYIQNASLISLIIGLS